ncbi:MAG: 30S ribosomal protein S13, partial [Acidimicrobiales bacterium]|nr:30S ribosomal protein S13 [Acidimicrobiales bacterium]
MARIAGVDVPREKRLGTSLTYIFGVGDTTAGQVCEATGIDPATRVRDLTDEEVTRLR